MTSTRGETGKGGAEYETNNKGGLPVEATVRQPKEYEIRTWVRRNFSHSPAIDDAAERALRKEVADRKTKCDTNALVIAALKRQVSDKDAIIRHESDRRRAAETLRDENAQEAHRLRLVVQERDLEIAELKRAAQGGASHD
jgi:hypothetical protein